MTYSKLYLEQQITMTPGNEEGQSVEKRDTMMGRRATFARSRDRTR